MDDFSVDVSINESVATIRARGELDAATAPLLDEMVRKVEVGAGLSEIALDFGAVSFVDSSGLSVLISAHKRLRPIGVTLAIDNTPPPIRRLFSIAGLDGVLTVR